MAELGSRLGQQVSQRQGQRLAPAQQQSIKLLSLTNLELADLLAEALAENPLLEPAADLPPAALARLAPKRRPGPGAPPNAMAAAQRLPAGLARLFGANRVKSGAGAGGESDAETPAPGPSLREHLLGQLGADIADPRERTIGQALIEAVDEAGYLTQGPDEVAARLAVAPARVESVLKRLQDFDPPGVFARSLAECLALQLADRDRLDAPMQRLLERLDLLAEGKHEALRRHCGVDSEKLAAMIVLLRRLDPRPGLAFEAATVQAVVPDLTIERDVGGGWSVALNAESLPRLAINAGYSVGADPQARAFLKEQRAAAQWLLRALDRRSETLRRIAGEIVKRQAGFLESGIAALKPLARREIARALDLHESTVSRALAGKYAATPQGVLALAAFFGARLPGADEAGGQGAGVAPAAARARLRRLIELEPAGSALSDQDLVRRLAGEGIALSRRTVAKYRIMLKIPPSHRRRRAASL
jgi:RNA polymerase sigma-54 factor